MVVSQTYTDFEYSRTNRLRCRATTPHHYQVADLNVLKILTNQIVKICQKSRPASPNNPQYSGAPVVLYSLPCYLQN